MTNRRSLNLIFREAEDRDLVLKARRGDVDAYNILISRWERRVFQYLVRLVGSREDAEDLNQEVFLRGITECWSGWMPLPTKIFYRSCAGIKGKASQTGQPSSSSFSKICHK